MEINNLKLLSREEILRRLSRMTGPNFMRRPNEITKHDVAKWVGVQERFIRLHVAGTVPISDSWQIVYSQFFALVDSGELVLQYPDGKKTLVRIPRPAEPPKKKQQPARIDFKSMSLKLEH